MKRVGVWAALLVVTVAFGYPFWWLVSASLKDRAHVFDNALLPRPFTPGNYAEVWQAVPLLTWIGNSVAVGLAAAVAATVTSALVAFGFAMFRFPGRNALFGVVLATMMLPAAVTMVPVYLEWHALGLATTQIPLWAQNLFGSAFYIFLLRQFFLGLPRSIFDAARTDGASDWQLFRHFALPLCKPALVVTLLFETQAAWTDLMRPLIYLRDANTFTVPRGLKAMLDQFGFAGNWHWELIITAGVITTIPMILLFFAGQRHFIQGIATTGTKG